jgi:hypothetical protein
MRACSIILLFFCFFSGVKAQDLALPLDIPLFLSGNFGELRANHFHSGIDFKTQGRTGIPVKSVKDGYISRINVSPFGYGKAIYIDHPDGSTSVYGHLDKFTTAIEAVVRDSQYQAKSFPVTLYFQPNELPVKMGERIGLSGNTGSSGGPHLHFEFRETASEKPVDPLPFFMNKIKDTRPPEIRGIMIFPQLSSGIVNGSVQNQAIALTKEQNIAQPIIAWGDIGIGIKAYDRMNDANNIYGVREIIFQVDGEVLYHSIMEKFSIDDTRYLNSYVDWKDKVENNSYYMKSFVDPGNRLGINQSHYNGIISIDEERNYRIEYTLKDLYGNTSTLHFDIIGKKTPIPKFESNDVYFLYHKNNEYVGKGIDLKIPRRNLYTDVYLKIDTIAQHSPFAPLYEIGDRIPLHSYCPLMLDIAYDTYPDKSKYGVVYNHGKNRRNWLGGEYQTGKMAVGVRELGKFSIEIDTVPPVITPVNPAQWENNKRISFKITDNLSGITAYRGNLDGEFVLFQYDAKTNSLFCVYDPKRMKTGKQFLHLVVTDKAGNSSEYQKEIVF